MLGLVFADSERMKQIHLIAIIFAGVAFGSCGGESHPTARPISPADTLGGNTTSEPTPTPSPSPEVKPASVTERIYARGMFQKLPVTVKSGDKISILSTGAWTGGQVDKAVNANQVVYCGAEGCNGSDVDLTTALCFTGTSTPIHAPGLTHKPNECLPGKTNMLLMKIVPADKNPYDIAPIAIGVNYQTNPYTVTSDGTLYFASNDADIGRADNDGFLDVTVKW
jgi:hypothetical protein